MRNHLSYTPPVLIDARLKPGFPDELLLRPGDGRARDAALERVLPGGGVEMGDAEAAHLDPV